MSDYLVGCEDEGLSPVEVEADDFDEAAEAAMQKWEESSAFAGDPYPGVLVVIVVEAATNQTKKVRVDVEWEPVYYTTIMEEEEHGA